MLILAGEEARTIVQRRVSRVRMMCRIMVRCARVLHNSVLIGSFAVEPRHMAAEAVVRTATV